MGWLKLPLSLSAVREGGRESIVWLNLLDKCRTQSDKGRVSIGWLNGHILKYSFVSEGGSVGTGESKSLRTRRVLRVAGRWFTVVLWLMIRVTRFGGRW